MRPQYTCQRCGTIFAASPSMRRLYCSRACYAARTDIPLAESFWKRVNKSGPIPAHCPELGPCWIWTGLKDGPGYARLRVNGAGRSATHISWELETGTPVPEDLFMCHRCDNPACVRVSHLFPGTQKVNLQDAKAKGRTRSGSRLHPEVMPRGEQNPGAKLTDAGVREMRALRVRGMSYPKIAARYGISGDVARKAINGITWKHI